MRDICSKWAYDEIVESGYVSKRQAMFLDVLSCSEAPLTANQIVKQIAVRFEKRFSISGIGSRLSELETKGFIKKQGKTVCEQTNKRVNQYVFTGRKAPFPKKMMRKECSCCEGKGFTFKEEFYDPIDPKQPELF